MTSKSAIDAYLNSRNLGLSDDRLWTLWRREEVKSLNPTPMSPEDIDRLLKNWREK